MKFTKKLSLAASFIAVVALLPVVTSAVTLKHTLGTVSGIVNAVIPIILAIAVIAFFWGLVMYLISDVEKKANGIQLMIMGLVAIFVMVSIWGIIRILQSTFKIDGSNKAIIPDVIERSYR